MRWPISIILFVLLTACGQKGDLYLPDKNKPEPVTNTQPQS